MAGISFEYTYAHYFVPLYFINTKFVRLIQVVAKAVTSSFRCLCFILLYLCTMILYSLMLRAIWVISIFPYYKEYCFEHCCMCFWYTSYFLVHIFVYMNLAVVEGISITILQCQLSFQKDCHLPSPQQCVKSSSALPRFDTNTWYQIAEFLSVWYVCSIHFASLRV